MIFFPILNAPNVEGYSCIANFPSNNWEVKYKGPLNLYLTFIKEGSWHNVYIETLPYNSFKNIRLNDIKHLIPENSLPLLSLNFDHLPKTNKELPKPFFPKTNFPSWRATLGLSSKFSEVSYQGEIIPFPAKASMLSLAPFIQIDKDIKNYALLMNIEKTPTYRNAAVKIFDLYTKDLLLTQKVTSNQINVISLDNLKVTETSLLALVCRNMAFIPLFFSVSKEGKSMSLEHTHPPSEFVVFGKKFGAQNHLKQRIFSHLDNV